MKIEGACHPVISVCPFKKSIFLYTSNHLCFIFFLQNSNILKQIYKYKFLKYCFLEYRNNYSVKACSLIVAFIGNFELMVFDSLN